MMNFVFESRIGNLILSCLIIVQWNLSFKTTLKVESRWVWKRSGSWKGVPWPGDMERKGQQTGPFIRMESFHQNGVLSSGWVFILERGSFTWRHEEKGSTKDSLSSGWSPFIRMGFHQGIAPCMLHSLYYSVWIVQSWWIFYSRNTSGCGGIFILSDMWSHF